MEIITHCQAEHLSLCSMPLLSEQWHNMLQKALLKHCNRWRKKASCAPHLNLSPPELFCLKDRSQTMAAQAVFISGAADSNPQDKQQPSQLMNEKMHLKCIAHWWHFQRGAKCHRMRQREAKPSAKESLQHLHSSQEYFTFSICLKVKLAIVVTEGTITHKQIGCIKSTGSKTYGGKPMDFFLPEISCFYHGHHVR